MPGEESDIDMDGLRKSHFELYLEAMQQAVADIGPIERFINNLKQAGGVKQALSASQTPKAAKSFVDFTFDIIGSNQPHIHSAIFTFGREDLIPGMFLSLISDLDQHAPDQISIFKYYLERHIEVDGDHHSHLALQMTANLCGDNEAFWKEAAEATMQSLQKRIELWNGVYDEITQRRRIHYD